jgi:hypothetical protein
MFRRTPALLLVVAPALSGCDATGSAQGGDPLQASACGADAGNTWTDLYACYFGPTGKASCSAQGTCHNDCTGTGALTSGFVCGGTKESCYLGITTPNCCGTNTSPPSDSGAGDGAADAGPIEASTACVGFSLLVPAGGSSDPAGTTLETALRGAPGVGLHNMPNPNDPTYTFTAEDIARISDWIREGAPQN